MSRGSRAPALVETKEFAGHVDWRPPNVHELQTLVDFGVVAGNSGSATKPAFEHDCTDGCTLDTCSCTAGESFWTSTSVPSEPEKAWAVDFAFGGSFVSAKMSGWVVRAVHGT